MLLKRLLLSRAWEGDLHHRHTVYSLCPQFVVEPQEVVVEWSRVLWASRLELVRCGSRGASEGHQRAGHVFCEWRRAP